MALVVTSPKLIIKFACRFELVTNMENSDRKIIALSGVLNGGHVPQEIVWSVGIVINLPIFDGLLGVGEAD